MKKRALQFSTALILTASFAVISGVLLIGQNLQRVLTLWGESLQMSVYLSETVTPELSEQIATTLKSNDKIDKIQYVPKEKALSQFREQMASYAPDLLNDNDLLRLIPSSYQFSISSKVSPSEQLPEMQEIAASLKVQPGVEDVSYGQDWVKSYSQISAAIQWAGWIFTTVIIGCAIFVISNCIRSSVHQRREEIEVLELVGATSSYIRKPFLVEGLSLCAISCIMGLAVTFGLFEVAQESMRAQLSFLNLSHQVQFLKPLTLFILLTGALSLGLCATWVCLRGLNDGWAASQKKQS